VWKRHTRKLRIILTAYKIYLDLVDKRTKL